MSGKSSQIYRFQHLHLVLAVLYLNGTVSSPRCSQSGCDVFHLGCVMSTFWMAYGCLGCLPAQGCCRLLSLGAWALCHWSPDCWKVHKLLPNLLVHLLQLSRSSHRIQPECPALVFDQLETRVPRRTHQLHCHHSWMLVHIPE